MSFDQSTLNIYGTVPSSGELNGLSQMSLVLTATDTSAASVSSSFTINITNSSSSSTNIVIIVIGAILISILIIGLVTALALTYHYWHKKTKGRIHVEEQTDKKQEGKDEEVNIENIEPKLDSWNEPPLETQREMRDTENIPSSAVSEEDENEYAFIENMTKYIITGQNKNNQKN